MTEASWSPGNKYVAVNNRRANAGDYLWLISLGDGNALKIPKDRATELGKDELGNAKGDSLEQTMREITSRFPDCANDDNYKPWLGAHGWKSPTELMVLAAFHFRKLQVWVEVNKVYQVIGNRVVLSGQTIERYTNEEEERRMRSDPNRGF